ncbi:MAG: aminomethyl-transferring glycine dehydrogenase subunit GcvPA, partial [Chloroflexi bacterium]|nr:aminomethyl-transferring glycine dehydrogenase subunit GcvPA [Chloroflexota bacterium]
MLEAIGVDGVERLFEAVPAEVRYPTLDLPPALSEMELTRQLHHLAERNQDLDHHPCFLGAGAYRHFVPAVVDSLLRRGEFYTAYTPYQAEASQGTLATTYEYQTMIGELTGMDVSNASLYDGGSATAEAALMAARITHRSQILLARSVHPAYRQVLRTYVQGLQLPVREIGYRPDGRIDWQEAGSALSDASACLILQHPNFLGVLEDTGEAAELVHQRGGLLIVVVDPIALGLFRPPGEEGADIVIGEGQPLGTPLQFGGPYLGFMACRERYLRQLPGRIVGLTQDREGRRGFVLTLQAREQHIRREKATSNICTNQALIALAATVYLAALGKQGLRRVAELCFHKAHYAAQRIGSLPGFGLPFGQFFKEFAVRTPRP